MLFKLIRQALSRRRDPVASYSAAFRQFQEGKLDHAERACKKLAGAGSLAGDVFYLRSLIAEQRKDFDNAASFCLQAIENKPDEPLFRLSLGKFLIELNRGKEAAQQFATAWDQLPPGHEARLKAALGTAGAIVNGSDPTAANIWCQRALEIDPGNPAAIEQLAFAFYGAGVAEAARQTLDSVRPSLMTTGLRIRRALFSLPTILDSQSQIDEVRRRYENDLDELLASPLEPLGEPMAEIGLTPFYLAYHGENDRTLMEKLGRVCRAASPPLAQLPRAPRRRKLRIALVSTFFYWHSIGRMNLGFVRHLPREHFDVQVFSITPTADEISKEFTASAELAVTLPARIAEVRKAIEEARPDVIFFTDIGMHPITYFVALHRLAPVQVMTWGHPVTSGIDTVDWFLSADTLEPPDGQSHYSERLMKLDGYFLPDYAKPTLKGPRRTRSDLGLPPGPLFACLQSSFKLHPGFDSALRNILERQPDAHLLLLDSRVPAWNARLRARMDRALGTAASRVTFMPRVSPAEYLQYVAQADVILDPFHFVGGNTSLEALALGKPVVTLPAAYVRGRFTQAMYREMEMDACIADSETSYVDLAVKLGTEPDFRHATSRQIEERCQVLFGRREPALELGERLRALFE